MGKWSLGAKYLIHGYFFKKYYLKNIQGIQFWKDGEMYHGSFDGVEKRTGGDYFKV